MLLQVKPLYMNINKGMKAKNSYKIKSSKYIHYLLVSIVPDETLLLLKYEITLCIMTLVVLILLNQLD